jgi:hypothetical protein
VCAWKDGREKSATDLSGTQSDQDTPEYKGTVLITRTLMGKVVGEFFATLRVQFLFLYQFNFKMIFAAKCGGIGSDISCVRR